MRLACLAITFPLAAPVMAQSAAPFTEEAVQRGIDFSTIHVGGAGHGVGFPDLDGDGDPDFVCLGSPTGIVGIYENDGAGFFTSRSAGSGIPALLHATGVIAADIDGDSDLDLFVACWDAPNVLLQNDGGFQFTDITQAAGVGDAGRSTGCAFTDFDGDGFVDLYVANMTGFQQTFPDRFYRNLGNGQFQNLAPALGIDFGTFTWQAVFFDYDRDADSDLYVSNDKGWLTCDSNNFLYENDGGSFVDVTTPSGAGICLDSMGVAVGDFDGNGFQDVYCTNIPGGNALLMNRGDKTFVEFETAAGVASFATGWGALFFDWDNDGYQDLYVCNQDAPNRLYEFDGTWPCTDIAATAGVDIGNDSYCLAVADIDADGDLDLALETAGGPVELFINHEGEQRSWARFRVIGQGANTAAIGATVDVRTGATWRTREVMSGTGFKCQNDLARHFGLGSATSLDEVVVTWPGGTTRGLTGYPVETSWALVPPERLGDADGDGDYELDDFFALFGPGGGAVTPGYEAADFDGDADIDTVDLDGFLAVFGGQQADCNSNGVLDLVEIFSGTALDDNQDGVLDTCECVMSSHCPPAPNSVGAGAVLATTGSASIAANELVLDAGPCPPGQFGAFFYGPDRECAPFGDGWLCVGGVVHRLAPVVVDGLGVAIHALDVTTPPDAGGAITAGSLWSFQFWYRDPTGPGGTAFNLSTAVEIQFCH
jgi:hypothetical protein